MSDHMMETRNPGTGWETPRIVPYHDIVLDPAASVFHYGTACFEGMKAYRDNEGHIRMFRPRENVLRMNSSIARLCLPTIDPDLHLEAIKELVRVDKDWIPQGKGYSLYLRPTCIATDAFLGVHPSKGCMLYTICSPSGPYYATGFKPIKLVADENHVRAWPGGHGAYKLGANYGPTILPAHEWEKKGYSQILGVGPNGIIMEGGAMNIFFFWINEQGEKELITCPLNGLILPGITRKSIIELTRSWNEFKVSEREFTIHDVARAAEEHRLLECFTSGTAAVCGSINGILYNGKTIDIPLDPNDASKPAGPITQRVYDELTGIQLGTRPNPFPEDP